MTKEELLYHYFSGLLTDTQEQEFNELLKNDEEFNEQFEFEKNLKETIKHKERQKLKTTLQSFERGIEGKKQHSSSNSKLWLVAASIALLISVGWYFYSASMAIDANALYATNFDKYPNTIYTITRDTTVDISLEYKAFEAYEGNDYKSSVALFTKLKETKNPEYIDFYLAQSYLNNNQLEKAIVLFKDITVHQKEFSTESFWYLSLAYLKTKQLENAKQSLEKLIKLGTYKKNEAVRLLKKLA